MNKNSELSYKLRLTCVLQAEDIHVLHKIINIIQRNKYHKLLFYKIQNAKSIAKQMMVYTKMTANQNNVCHIP